MSLTRRELVQAVAAASVTAKVLAQPAAASDLDRAAQEDRRAASEGLAKIELATSVEPAFHFKP